MVRQKRAAWLWSAAAGVSGAAALVMWGVTTYLFAFSGGQARMVDVVGLGAAVMLFLPLLACAAARFVSPSRALAASVAVTVIGWPATVLVEWLLSFRLGAGA